MRTILFAIGSICICALASGQTANTPEWLNDIPTEDVIWGIGTAKFSNVSMSMQIAEVRARTSIACQLAERAVTAIDEYGQDSGIVETYIVNIQENVRQTIISVRLTGTQIIKRWQAPDGTWWYLVEYKKPDARSTVGGILQSQEDENPQFIAEQALVKLDAQLARSEKPLVVSE